MPFWPLSARITMRTGHACNRIAQRLAWPVRNARLGPFAIFQSLTTRQPGMQTQESGKCRGEDADVECDEASQREVAELRSAGRQLEQPVADSGNEEQEAASDASAPEAVLVPGKQVARQVQAQCDEPQGQHGPEHELARRPIGRSHDDLHHVDADQHEEHLGGIMMNRSEQPATGDFMLQVVDAFPCGLGARAVIHPHDHPGDRLRDERKDDRGRPHESKTRPVGDRTLEPIADGGAKTRPLVNPRKQLVHDFTVLCGSSLFTISRSCQAFRFGTSRT